MFLRVASFQNLTAAIADQGEHAGLLGGDKADGCIKVDEEIKPTWIPIPTAQLLVSAVTACLLAL
jgi:hypothetical protein